jgi:sugar-specific transcriptional regulator TrmB
MSSYQAKVYAALATLGSSGVAEIQRVSGVPRTKIYEVLEQLVGMGAVEFQSGRPVIYNALSPSLLVNRMRDSYLSAANEATKLLAEMRQVGRISEEDLAWTVRGETAVRRKALSTIASAKKTVHMIEQYPLYVIPAANSIFKAILQRGVAVKAFCLLKEGQKLDRRVKGEDFVEFRRVSTKMFTGNSAPYAELRGPMLLIISRASFLIIVDDVEAFVSFLDKADPSKSLGLTLKVPGLPLLQRIFLENILGQVTTKVK